MEGVEANTSFPKKERLCGKTAISKLLAQGRHGSVPGMRYLFMKDTGLDHARLLVSVPKKIFKRAVKRNLLKRRIRESWRRLKHNLVAAEHGMDILFIYSTKEVMTYQDIYTHIESVISKLNENQAKQKRNETASE